MRKKVFVALSGGVDSSVSLYLLKKAGYDVTAAFIKIGECVGTAGQNINPDECWIGERREAARVAAYLDVPFVTFDFDKEYEKEVLNYFFKEYKAGRTPNPDVMCNRKIKFPLFWKKAKSMGADFMATGHYARIKSGKLLVGKDKEKDQSYFIYNLKKDDFEHILFPVGGYTKKEVRAIAKKAGLPTAEKKDSQGLCFLGHINVREFLKTKIKPEPGNIINVKGDVIGRHEGLAYYTIGQRHGIGVFGAGEPHFVVDKDFKKNLLIVAPEREEKKYFKNSAEVTDINWVAKSKFPISCMARIRYRAPLEKCVVEKAGASSLKIKFSKPQRAITPGQSVVFYKGEEVLGGGIIK
ncbi:MAG: tRNA 2-thiouridine(34) synthase MnmA [Patescibacteria group bacterium]